MTITPLGDSALIVRSDEKSDDAPERTLREVLATKSAIERARIRGVLECASAYTTVAVFFDPTDAIAQGARPDGVMEWFESHVREAIESTGPKGAPSPARQFKVPMCCEGEFALDLKDVAVSARLTEREVIDLYCATDFQVRCIGFTPGFPYLAGLPEKLFTPRRSIPRTKIAAGSVAIGGGQAGIYPMVSPGGWNVIGRTPWLLFNPEENPPALLRAGDSVRFKSIACAEFDALYEGSSVRPK